MQKQLTLCKIAELTAMPNFGLDQRKIRKKKKIIMRNQFIEVYKKTQPQIVIIGSWFFLFNIIYSKDLIQI
jgi:hypothetical protein